MAKNFVFPKSSRLLNSKDFEYLRRGSSRVSTSLLRIYYKKTRIDSLGSRIGYSVSKKVGNAVIRNRVKRLLRENFRKWDVARTLGLDFLVIVSPALFKSPSSVKNAEDELLKSFEHFKRQVASKKTSLRSLD